MLKCKCLLFRQDRDALLGNKAAPSETSGLGGAPTYTQALCFPSVLLHNLTAWALILWRQAAQTFY